MNNAKRTFNPLLSDRSRYKQLENTSLKLSGNWGAKIQPANLTTASTWTIEAGSLTLSSEAVTTSSPNTTSVIISGSPGFARVVNKVTLDDGQVDEHIIDIKILENDNFYLDNDYHFYDGGCR